VENGDTFLLLIYNTCVSTSNRAREEYARLIKAVIPHDYMNVNSDRAYEIGIIVEHLVVAPSMFSILCKAKEQAVAILKEDSFKRAGTVQIPLESFGPKMPPELQSCRLSVMRSGTPYYVERHPNAIQYVYSLEHSGSIGVYDGASWRVDELRSDPSLPLESRWHSVPANTWHQPVPRKEHWTVLGFHSVPVAELIDDYEFNGPQRAL